MAAPLTGDWPDESDGNSFDRAVALLTTAIGPDDDLWSPFMRPTSAAGAVISTLGDPLGTQTVGASDDLAARIDEIQIDLGEGPSWEALRSRQPVLTSDIHGDGDGPWPTARSALRELDLAALFAFPLFVGHVGVGSVGLYTLVPGHLSPDSVRGVTVLAGIAARQVLRRALDALDDGGHGIPAGPYSRREMHQAAGMIAAQLSIGVDDALVVMRGHAFAAGRSVLEVAADVVARRMELDA